MKRAVVLYELMSLDGFADDPGEGEWFDSADQGLMDFFGEVISTQDTILLGRRTFDKWVPYWPSSTMHPFADFANTTRKIVFTSTPLTREWAGAERAVGSADSVVANLKQRPGGDIGIHGSLSLARSLLAAGLVDELRLVMAPNLAGTGKDLFDRNGALRRFDLVSSERSGGCLLLHYRIRT